MRWREHPQAPGRRTRSFDSIQKAGSSKSATRSGKVRVVLELSRTHARSHWRRQSAPFADAQTANGIGWEPRDSEVAAPEDGTCRGNSETARGVSGRCPDRVVVMISLSSPSVSSSETAVRLVTMLPCHCDSLHGHKLRLEEKARDAERG